MNQKYKFGDKNFGRNSLERTLILLEQNKTINIIVSIFFLIFLVGTNSVLHGKSQEGLIFLLFTSIILIGNKIRTEQFWGTSIFALVLIIHISIFGFSSLPILFSYIIVLLFGDKMGKNILLPVTIFLVIDSGIVYYDLTKYTNDFFEKTSKFIFEQDVLCMMLIIPLSYLYLKLERWYKKRYNKDFLLILYIIIFVIAYLIFIYNITILKGLFWGLFLIYVVGLTFIKKDNNKLYFYAALTGVLFIFLRFVSN